MKKITMSVAAAAILVSGLAGCGVDNQATDMQQQGIGAADRHSAFGVDRRGPGVGVRNDLGGQVDHDGGFFRGQGRQPGEVQVGQDRPRGFGTDFGQGRAGGFFGLDGDRQGQMGTAQGQARGTDRERQGGITRGQNQDGGQQQAQRNGLTIQSLLSRIQDIDGVKEARMSDNVIEITVNDGADKGEVKRKAEKMAEGKTLRLAN
ncbi:hypothetical protein [Halalkalibacter alkaliphilus]|uniref:Uncharacterized protein n=1 Tax=Halalkalibacter alkaliphilus TaxID=2917993 RepID=A0A9X2CNM9_9BACI|nr:hypothetical protein [Halalkalibacter alkaliphilus]MCL7746833.1 hypothetical protein [Halalkalibacter alkaliphilus]